MPLERKTGIIGWGTYIPMYRIRTSEIARVWGIEESSLKGLGVLEKAVGGPDEDTITIGWEAARNAVVRAGIDPREIEAVFVGTESKPYAVKPSSTVIAEALGITPETMASDLEFACRAGAEAVRISIGLVASGMIKYALAIGADTAQANPGDHLDLTVASGGAAFIIGPVEESVAFFEGSYTYVTDTPDFWRRSSSPYPLHGESFTGEPAYFHHIVSAARGLMEKLGLKPSDFDYAVFHQPNARFPLKAASKLGIPKERVKLGLVSPWIGNTYSGAVLIGLARVLEHAKPGERILVVSFGSGAGSDAFSIITTDALEEKKRLAPTVDDYLSRKVYVDYALYSRFRGTIKVVCE